MDKHSTFRVWRFEIGLIWTQKLHYQNRRRLRWSRTIKEKGDTWPKVLKFNYEKYGDTRRALRYKHHGIWQPFTWKDYYLNVKSLALGLMSLGVKPGDKVLIVGDNAPEWYYADLAAQADHGVSVGAYSDLTPSGD